MPLVRKIFLSIAGTALVFFLFVTAVDIAVVRVFGSPEPIKKVLNESGIYNSIVSGSLEQAKQISKDNNEISLDNQGVRQAAESTFDGQFLQKTTNDVIDSIYRWLDGQTPIPDFKIDLTAKKTEFADKVAAAAKDRMAGLPKCTTASSGSFDAFNATCLPVGANPDQLAGTVRSDVLSGSGFIDKPVLTAADVKSDNSDRSVFTDQLKNTPQAYRNLKSSPWALGLLILISATAVIYLSSSRLKGIRHVGFLLAGVGIFLVLFALSINAALDNKILPKIDLNNAVEQASVRKLVRDSVHKVDSSFWAMGLGYMVLGALAIGGYYYLVHKRPVPEPANENIETTDDSLYKPDSAAKSPAKKKTKT